MYLREDIALLSELDAGHIQPQLVRELQQQQQKGGEAKHELSPEELEEFRIMVATQDREAKSERRQMVDMTDYQKALEKAEILRIEMQREKRIDKVPAVAEPKAAADAERKMVHAGSREGGREPRETAELLRKGEEERPKGEQVQLAERGGRPGAVKVKLAEKPEVLEKEGTKHTTELQAQVEHLETEHSDRRARLSRQILEMQKSMEEGHVTTEDLSYVEAAAKPMIFLVAGLLLGMLLLDAAKGKRHRRAASWHASHTGSVYESQTQTLESDQTPELDLSPEHEYLEQGLPPEYELFLEEQSEQEQPVQESTAQVLTNSFSELPASQQGHD